MDAWLTKKQEVERVREKLQEISLSPEDVNGYLNFVQSSPLVIKQRLSQLVLRPGIDLHTMMQHVEILREQLSSFSREAIEQAEIQVKYETYIEKERDLVQRMSQLENLTIPENFNYERLVSLSTEARQKFSRIQPRTLGQASRISGVNPSDIQILMLFMGR